jgi:hypothetical protein
MLSSSWLPADARFTSTLPVFPAPAPAWATLPAAAAAAAEASTAAMASGFGVPLDPRGYHHLASGAAGVAVPTRLPCAYSYPFVAGAGSGSRAGFDPRSHSHVLLQSHHI